MKLTIALMALIASGSFLLGSNIGFESDTLKTSDGNLVITFIGHGTLMFEFNDKVLHVDPVGRYADYSLLPDADIILITHEHGDHLDPNTIGQIVKKGTQLICTETAAASLDNPLIMKNGDQQVVEGFSILAVPAYNRVHSRGDGSPFHPKGVGNGYIIDFSDLRVYIAGDTENIPEMADFQDVDIAFLPVNLPYTMTPEMVADAVRMFNPRVLYPYHYGETDVGLLPPLLKDLTDLEIRVRQLQ